MSEATRTRRVTVEVPTDPFGVRVCRLLLAGLGDELDLDVEQIEDLRIAVDELAYLVVDADVVPDGPLRVEAEVTAGRLEVRGSVETPEGWDAPALEQGSIQARLLGRVADEHGVDAAPGAFHFRFVKTLSPVDAG